MTDPVIDPAPLRPDHSPWLWRPQLAAQANKPPKGRARLHEVKFDGYRTVAIVDRGRARLLTRNGHDWTHRYGDIADRLGGLPCGSAIIDGEIAVADARGVTRLDLLQRALVDGVTSALTFHAFDLVRLDGADLSGQPLTGRKAVLAGLLAGRPDLAPKIQLSQTHEDGDALFAAACAAQMEGIVSKQADAPYVHARSASWVKVKRRERGDFHVVGFLTNRPGEVSSVVLAEPAAAGLVLSCRAGVGGLGRRLHDLLSRSERDTPPIHSSRIRGVRWVAPEWRAQVTYLGRSGRGTPRSPVVTCVDSVTLACTAA